MNTYTYNAANQLTALSEPFGSSAFSYNGLGDRLTQNGVNYTLDLNAGLTQVLNDGTNTYLYGLGRIAENQGGVSEYYLGDALGSVRQLVNDGNEITLARTYEPYGDLAQATGTAQTSYGFTGELTDPSGLVYLRARYYAPEQGRFITRDTWDGDVNTPASLNRFNYAHSNPVMYIDPSGHFAQIIAGAALGGFIGLIGGRAFAELTYGWALQGKCGCDMQMWALTVGRPWIDQTARQGFIIGAVGGAVASAGPVGVIIVGAFGVTTSAIDALRTVYQVVAQGGFDNCTLLRFAADVGSYIVSAWSISAGANVALGAPSRVISASERIQGLRSRLPNGKTFADLTPEEWRTIIPRDWKYEFDYYKPQQTAEWDGVVYDFTDLEFPQWKFMSPDGNMEIRLHSAQPPYDTSWVARIGIRKGVPGTEGLTSFPNLQNKAESWVYYDAYGIPTKYQKPMHLPIKGLLSDFIRVFSGYYP